MLRSLQTTKGHFPKIDGLLAAAFTPFSSKGDLDLNRIPKYVEFLHKHGIKGVFVCGTTGEGASLTVDERKKVAETWMEKGCDKLEYIIVQVGSACLKDAQNLAKHANDMGAYGIGCVPPYFMKNIPLSANVKFLQQVAQTCPDKPFYYYHFPNMTGVNFPASQIMTAAKDIPNLAGLKFTAHDYKDACQVANFHGGRFQVLGGFDDLYLARLALGIGDACIGAFYNFAPGPAIRLKTAYDSNNMDQARLEQWRLQQIAAINQKYTTGLTCKEYMEMIDLDMGPPRLPLTPLSDDQKTAMRKDLEEIGFFDWYI